MPETEPEKYSIDEMMDRLRSRDDRRFEGEPELVTRPDGSQVIKVRKRKRRSHQPHKEAEKRRRRRTLVGTAVGMTVLMLGVLGLVAWYFYLNSGAYSDQVAGRIKAWTGAELEMRSFRATPVNAAADYLKLTWAEDLPAASFEVHQLRGDLRVTSHLTGVWEGQQMGGGRGELVLRAVGNPGRLDLPGEPLPFRTPLRVNQLNIRFGDGERAAFAVYNANASLAVPVPERPEGNLMLQNGTCRIGRWGSFDLDFASLRLASDGLHLGSIRLSPQGDDSAEFVIVGEGFPVVPVAGGEAAYLLKVQAMPSLVLFGGGLGTIVEGTFETLPEDKTGRVSVDPTRLDSLRIDVPVRSASGSILKFYRLPMFEVLAELLDTARFVQPRFDPESSMRVVRSGESVVLEDVDLVAEAMLRVRGRIEEGTGGNLSGTLELGIADALLVLADTPAAAKVFGKSAGGYRWATVELSGTTKTPADNLAAQLAGTIEAMSPAEGGERGLEDAFREATTPSE